MTSDKKQAEMLMNDLLQFAEKMLGSHAEFHPFGGYLTCQESVVHVGVSPDFHWENAQQRVTALTGSLKSIAVDKQPLVVGIATSVSMSVGGESRDAVRIFLEHQSGYSADVFFYYRIVEGNVSIDDVRAQRGVPCLYERLGADH